MASDSIKRTIVVALAVCFICSILVSTAAVFLKERQTLNKKKERIKNILIAGDLLDPSGDWKTNEGIYNTRIKTVLIDLKTGNLLDEKKGTGMLAPENYDIKKVAKHPDFSEVIPDGQDMANIKSKPKYGLLYCVKKDDNVIKYIIPVYGRGLWSTMYGFLALDADLKTIKGFTFYEHGETPGLGGEVDNPRWKALWTDKLAFDDNLNLKIEVIKGRVDISRPDSRYKVDGLSGSTLTTRGVSNLVRFWLGDLGYGPFIEKVREEGLNGKI